VPQAVGHVRFVPQAVIVRQCWESQEGTVCGLVAVVIRCNPTVASVDFLTDGIHSCRITIAAI